jgi:RAVE protein 1 C terminal
VPESGDTLIINDPSLMILYDFLKAMYKTLIMEKRPSLSISEEYEFILQCAAAYDKIGCPTLAMQIIKENNLHIMQRIEVAASSKLSGDEDLVDSGTQVNSLEPSVGDKLPAQLDWGSTEVAQTVSLFDDRKPAVASNFDWGEMESTFTSKALDFGDLETSLAPVEGIDDDFAEFEKSLMMNSDQAKYLPSPTSGEKSVELVSPEEYELVKLRRQRIQAYLWYLSTKIVQVFYLT